MPSRPHRASTVSAARRAVERALAVARQQGAPALARISRPTTAPNFQSILRTCLDASVPALAWHDAARGQALMAIGRVDAATVTDGQQASHFIDRVRPTVIEADGHDHHAPFAIFGLPFDAANPASKTNTWHTWPTGGAFIPACIWRCSESREQATETVHLVVHPDDTVDAALARWAPPSPQPASAQGWAGVETPIEARPAWLERVAAAAAACARGPLRKVVLARAVRFAPQPGTRFDAAAIFAALAARNGQATAFALSFGDGVAFVGATPETLAVVDGRRVTTSALAGTAPRDATLAADAALADGLLRSAKDRAEHQAVVEGIRAALRPLCSVLSADRQPRLRRLPAVQHLETRFEGRLRADVSLLAVVNALHPTPALGGLPHAEARAWLRETEPLDRRQYAAPLGWIGLDGGGVAVVGIRAALVEPEAVVAFAGAGVVAASDPAAEWHETHLKLTPIRDALRVVPS